jgi:hypothetical protein
MNAGQARERHCCKKDGVEELQEDVRHDPEKFKLAPDERISVMKTQTLTWLGEILWDP